MGVNFRKSKKVAPGTRINIGKKSAGVSFGNRGGGVSFNSRTGARVRASIPGTGISFSSRLTGRKRRRQAKTAGPTRISKFITAALFLGLISWAAHFLIPVLVLLVVGVFVWAFRSAKREQASEAAEAAKPEPRRIEVSCPCSEKFQVTVNKPGDVLTFVCPKCGQRLRVDTSI